MMKIIPRPSTTLAFGWLVLFMGVNSVEMSPVESLPETTAVTTLQPESKFYFEIRITNRIYNTTLEDQESAEYVTLRQEVDQLFWDIYSLSAVYYINTDQVTFRNGSVIAGADLVFATNMINPYLLRNLFLLNYKTLKSPQLRIDRKFIAAELPTPQPLEDTSR